MLLKPSVKLLMVFSLKTFYNKGLVCREEI